MDVRLPKLGEGAESGTVVSVAVKEGDVISKGQTILELENEKAVAPIPSTVSGTVTSVRIKEGDKLSVGQVIVTVSEGSETRSQPPATGKRQEISKPMSSKEILVSQEPETSVQPQPEPAGTGLPPAASPSLRKMARELGIDLSRIRGREAGGRIVMADVRAYVQRLEELAAQPKAPAASKPQPPARERIDFSKWGTVNAKPLSPLRKVIIQRMTESWTTIPHVTQFDEADITAVMELRKKYAAAYEQGGARLTLTSFALKAVAATLRKHPILNTSLDEVGGEIVFKDYYHIGLAVDTEQGLIVPVIRDVDKKSMLEISKEVGDLAEKARNRKVSLEEMKGGTFTISNQGGIGGAHFTPIINKPEVAILGLGRGAVKPVAKGGNIESRVLLPLGLSYDHRVIDGGNAARFMVDLVQMLESFPEEELKGRGGE